MWWWMRGVVVGEECGGGQGVWWWVRGVVVDEGCGGG